MSAKKAATTAVASSDTDLPLAILAHFVTPKVLELLRERLALTDEKVMLMLLRRVNPDEVLFEKEEQLLRGVSEKTLKSYKDNGLIPKITGGIK